MAAAPDAPATAIADDTAERALERDERRWKIRVAKADVLQKVLVSIIGAAIAAIFYVYQANQTQSRYNSDLQAQRERADADLRANMFKTLFDAYFKNKFEAGQRAATGAASTPASAEALLANLGQETMLSDLLARNFETMDVRPLFEDLDRRLTGLVERDGEGDTVTPLQAGAFRQREELRRVAYGATTRQIELLQANAKARVQRVRVKQCQASASSPPVFTPDFLPGLPGDVRGLIKRVGDGSVDVALRVPDSDAGARMAASVASGGAFNSALTRWVPIGVTYFDMPALENVRLPDGTRMSLTLTRSASARSCARFQAQMDESARKNCDPLPDAAPQGEGICNWAYLSITLIPKEFIGMRDRPYLNELSKSTDPVAAVFDLLRSDRPAASPR
jgi:hypothetical protein